MSELSVTLAEFRVTAVTTDGREATWIYRPDPRGNGMRVEVAKERVDAEDYFDPDVMVLRTGIKRTYTITGSM